MRRFAKLLVAVYLVFAATACNINDDDDDGLEVNVNKENWPTYAEAEPVTDMQNLVETEEDLQDLGYKFRAVTDNSFGKQTVYYLWDREFRQKYLQRNPEQTDASLAIENYIKKADEFLKKYANFFYLKKPDGTTATEKLLASSENDIVGKLRLATQTLTKIKSRRQEN